MRAIDTPVTKFDLIQINGTEKGRGMPKRT